MELLSMYSGKELNEFLKEKIDRLLKIAPEIRLLYQRPDRRMEIRGIEQEIKELLVRQKILAGMETDEDKKKKFTNDATREVRAKERLKDDPEYIELKKMLGELQAEQFEIDVERNALRAEIDILGKVIPALGKIYERETVEIQIKGAIRCQNTKVS